MNLATPTACVGLVLAAAASVPTAAAPASPAPAGHSPELAETLRWLPADTDAVLVAQEFDLLKSQQPLLSNESIDPLADAIRLSAAGQMLSHDALRGPYDRLAGRKVDFALLAGREFFPISAFGFLGYAGCHIVRFAAPLGDDAGPFADSVRKGAAENVSLSGRDVAVFQWAFGKEPYLKDRPWEALLVVLPKADDRELIVATERTLLASVLERRAQTDAPRVALPPTMDAWKYLDGGAAAWAVLAAPTADDGSPSTTNALTWEYHIGDDSRFVLHSPAASLPDVDPATIDPYAKNYQMGPLSLVYMLAQQKVSYRIERPAGEPVRLSVPCNAADVQLRAMGRISLVFTTGALFGYCLDP